MRLSAWSSDVFSSYLAVDRELLDLVRRCAALIIALARITLGIFVGEDRALRLEHRLRDDVLAGDQLDLMALALEFVGDAREHRRIGIGETAREEAVGLDVGQRGRIGAHADSLTVFGAASGRASLSTRARWRPPAKSVSRKSEEQTS